VTIEGATTSYGYTYDQVGRLEQVRIDGQVEATYTYADNSNRSSVTDGQGDVVSGTSDDHDRLLFFGPVTYGWTDDGQLQTKTVGGQTTTFTYDVLGNLVQVDLPDGRTIEYLIDGSGRRVGKRVNGVLERAWLYAGGLSPIAEYDGAGQLVSMFVYADPSGLCVTPETVFDATMFAYSLTSCINCPSWVNCLSAAADGLAVALPVVPAVAGAALWAKAQKARKAMKN
jgi:YD repeat-containing protein